MYKLNSEVSYNNSLKSLRIPFTNEIKVKHKLARIKLEEIFILKKSTVFKK